MRSLQNHHGGYKHEDAGDQKNSSDFYYCQPLFHCLASEKDANEQNRFTLLMGKAVEIPVYRIGIERMLAILVRGCSAHPIIVVALHHDWISGIHARLLYQSLYIGAIQFAAERVTQLPHRGACLHRQGVYAKATSMRQSKVIQVGITKIEDRIKHVDSPSVANAGHSKTFQSVLDDIIGKNYVNRERILTAPSDGTFTRQVLQKSDQQYFDEDNGGNPGIVAVGMGLIRRAIGAGLFGEIQFLEQCIECISELRRRSTEYFVLRNPQFELDRQFILLDIATLIGN